MVEEGGKDVTNHQIDQQMKKIASGDGAALEALYQAMHKPVYFYALRLTGDAGMAEDVMQETFVAVLRKAAAYRTEGKGKSWIFTIAKNLTVDMQRRQNHFTVLELPTELPDAEDFTAHSDSGIAALDMLRILNPKERNIVMLRLLSDMTLTEVAKELQIPAGTVFWTYNNAIRKMRKQFAGGEYDEK